MMSCFIWLYFVCMVATVREKYLKNEIFSRSGKSQGILWMASLVREKSGNLRMASMGQGNLERTCKVRGKSGNFKIDGYGRQSSENLFILFKRGRIFYLMR